MNKLVVMMMTVAGVLGLPSVFMHGLGDSGSNTGMKNLAASVTKAYGVYSVSVDVANGFSSYTETMDVQVKEFAEAVRADPKLKDGFNLVGLSQGAVIARAYVQQYNDPPVRNLVSVNGPQSGVGECPAGTPAFICGPGQKGLYAKHFSFAGYWKDVADKDEYLSESRFLADLNNDREEHNATYRANMINLNKYVLVKALDDTVVIPKDSEWHGFWTWGDKSTVTELHDSEGFRTDALGLQTLEKAGKLELLSFKGDHLKFDQDFWDKEILPFLAPEAAF